MAEKDYSADIKKIKEFIEVMCWLCNLDTNKSEFARDCLNALNEIEKALKD